MNVGPAHPGGSTVDHLTDPARARWFSAANLPRAAAPAPAPEPAEAVQIDRRPGAEAMELVPVLGLGQELVLRLLALVWVGATLWFWLWWLSSEVSSWSVGRSLSTLGLTWNSLLGAYFAFFACRMSKPDPGTPVPAVRAAIIVTKAPAEPWAVVQQTLQAMLGQDYPHPYDVWLADEQPTLESLRWCLTHRMHVSCRRGQAGYHRESWPRRKACKEGNLAYFYDTVGYADYDVVAQLDADHVPEPAYLSHMVRPFASAKVGYVAAPSICDANAAAGWTVRGRMHREASMHGPIQAGCNGGWAPVCIGSHYAVRTAALADIGGLGPDLAEDYSTSLAMLSAGWEGTFSPDALAHGDGPETLRDMLTQESQWARSLGTILTRWSAGQLRSTAWPAAPRMAFALWFYLLQGLLGVLGTALPVYGTLTNTTWNTASAATFYLHLWLCSLPLLAMFAWLRRCGTLRPRRAPLFSWEAALFVLWRWPFVLVAFVQGMYVGLRRTEQRAAVTPKGRSGRTALRGYLLLPTCALAALPTATLVVTRGRPHPLGLSLLLVLQGLTYLVALVSVVALHLRSAAPAPASRAARRRRSWPTGTVERRALAFVVGCAATLLWRCAELLGGR